MRIRQMFAQCLFHLMIVAFLAGITPQTSFADVRLIEKQTDEGTLQRYVIKIQPAAEPVPALKYRFTVLPHETKAGNSVSYYLRSFGENQLTGRLKRMEEKYGMEIYDWVSDIPLADLPLEQLKDFSDSFDGYVDGFLRKATVCRDADWGAAEEEFSGMEAIEMLLPSMQQTRSISRALMIRARLAIAEGRYEDAIEELKINYRLAESVNKMKFLVCGLVGTAEMAMGLQTTIDLIGAPDSPNLYWALAELPTPMLDLRDSLRLELSIGLRIIPELKTVETANHTKKEWKRIYDQTIESLSRIDEMIGSNNPTLPAGLIGFSSYTNAKKRLIAGGMSSNDVKQMPVCQALLIDAKREYLRIANEAEKVLYASGNFRDFRNKSLAAESLIRIEGVPNLGQLLADKLLPASTQVKTAQFRLEWQRRCLQAIEAIRMHAAETGRIPQSLDDIRVVPVPKNPVTGQPFLYKYISDTQAVLELPFSDGMYLARRFELELTKKQRSQ